MFFWRPLWRHCNAIVDSLNCKSGDLEGNLCRICTNIHAFMLLEFFAHFIPTDHVVPSQWKRMCLCPWKSYANSSLRKGTCRELYCKKLRFESLINYAVHNKCQMNGSINTLRPRQNGRPSVDDIFKFIFPKYDGAQLWAPFIFHKLLRRGWLRTGGWGRQAMGITGLLCG